MRIKCLVCLAFMIVALLSPRAALASVGGQVSGLPANPCGSTGTLYNNQTSSTMRVELSLTNLGLCSASFSWTDAAGHPQSINLVPNDSIVVSTSLEANSVLSWTSSANANYSVDLLWELEQPPSQSVGMPGGSTAPQLIGANCGSTGTLYKNLTGASTTLNLGVSNGAQCGFTVSWTDSNGIAQTINVGLNGTQGVSTTLPAGGTITWSSGSGSGPIYAGWRLERRVSNTM
jgi:hypothetical protein